MEISKEYLLLFNTITDTIEELKRTQQQLISAQQKAEELYISREDDLK